MTQTQININSAAYRLAYRPQSVTCECCYVAQATRRICARSQRNGEYVTLYVCDYCRSRGEWNEVRA